MLLTPDGGFNRGSVVGKRVPGTWSRVLDVLVWCRQCKTFYVLDTRVGPLAGTPIYRDRSSGTPNAPWLDFLAFCQKIGA